MNILYITNKPIYPIVDGGCFAMDSFLRALLCFASVKNITVATHKHPFDLNEYPKEIATKINPVGYLLNTKTNLLSFLKAVITNSSYNASRFYNQEFLAAIKLEIQHN